jgi:hypothetical protein
VLIMIDVDPDLGVHVGGAISFLATLASLLLWMRMPAQARDTSYCTLLKHMFILQVPTPNPVRCEMLITRLPHS